MFLIAAATGAAANAAVLIFPEDFTLVLIARLLVGLSLAGVSPVGMKIAAGWYGGGPGWALGYFGHMWEFYAFWAFVPVWIGAHGLAGSALSATAFAVIAAGFLGCAGGGLFVPRPGGGRVALGQLGLSTACCLLTPLMLYMPTPVFIVFLLVWGVAVAGDSPRFSALTAYCAPRALVGPALTLVTSIGFAITVASLSLLEWLQHVVPPAWLPVPLAFGPVAGLLAGRPLVAGMPVSEGPAARHPVSGDS